MKGKFKESYLLPGLTVKPIFAIKTLIPREKLNPPTPSIYVSLPQPSFIFVSNLFFYLNHCLYSKKIFSQPQTAQVFPFKNMK